MFFKVSCQGRFGKVLNIDVDGGNDVFPISWRDLRIVINRDPFTLADAPLELQAFMPFQVGSISPFQSDEQAFNRIFKSYGTLCKFLIGKFPGRFTDDDQSAAVFTFPENREPFQFFQFILFYMFFYKEISVAVGP